VGPPALPLAEVAREVGAVDAGELEAREARVLGAQPVVLAQEHADTVMHVRGRPRTWRWVGKSREDGV